VEGTWGPFSKVVRASWRESSGNRTLLFCSEAIVGSGTPPSSPPRGSPPFASPPSDLDQLLSTRLAQDVEHLITYSPTFVGARGPFPALWRPYLEQKLSHPGMSRFIQPSEIRDRPGAFRDNLN